MDYGGWGIYVSEWVRGKLVLHDVEETEVEEAFCNSGPPYLRDDREEHRTVPPTYWFVALTMDDRPLKVIFIPYEEEKIIRLKSAYEPTEQEIERYVEYQEKRRY